MTYEERVRKEIAKHTGLTGVEAQHIHRQLEKSGQDYQAFDWKSIGENLYGHGHRTQGVKSIISQAYGVRLGEHEDNRQQFNMMEIEMRQNRRSPRSIQIDNSRQARRQYQPTNNRGVNKWMKKPNMFDIIGIDDKIKKFNRKKGLW